MNFFATVRVAVRALGRNVTRSVLTTLGIVIGVGAVIAMVAIGQGAKKQVEDQFASMGTNLLIVLPGSSTAGGAMGGFGSQPTLTWDDLHAIATELSSVRAASPQLRSNGQVQGDGQNWATSISGTTPAYFEVRNWPAESGRLINQADVDGSAKVVVLGKTVTEKLFGANVNPTGQSIRIKGVPYDVIGVMAAKGQSPMGQDYDDAVVIPVTTFQTKVQGGMKRFLTGPILVSARDNTARALKQIKDLLRERHHLGVSDDDDFSVRDLTELASAQQQGTQTLTILLASIAAVSLFVGGIGIMNIMLVSVTERTREIGIRMAVGATPSNIMAQFLVEALALALLGGLLGTGLGVAAARVMAAKFGWATLVQPDIILVAWGFSAAVGIVFGLYPARKASQLDPIDALRFE
ncbi:MAG TPA: ABC transporter permease [Myxococcota bacterium]|jgi:putative ABC transport system permease protein